MQSIPTSLTPQRAAAGGGRTQSGPLYWHALHVCSSGSTQFYEGTQPSLRQICLLLPLRMLSCLEYVSICCHTYPYTHVPICIRTYTVHDGYMHLRRKKPKLTNRLSQHLKNGFYSDKSCESDAECQIL